MHGILPRALYGLLSRKSGASPPSLHLPVGMLLFPDGEVEQGRASADACFKTAGPDAVVLGSGLRHLSGPGEASPRALTIPGLLAS